MEDNYTVKLGEKTEQQKKIFKELDELQKKYGTVVLLNTLLSSVFMNLVHIPKEEAMQICAQVYDFYKKEEPL